MSDQLLCKDQMACTVEMIKSAWLPYHTKNPTPSHATPKFSVRNENKNGHTQYSVELLDSHYFSHQQMDSSVASCMVR